MTRTSAEFKKEYSIIRGKLKSNNKWEDQAFRYPKNTWTETEGRKHCKRYKGRFEAATEENQSMENLSIAVPIETLSLDDEKRTATFIALSGKPIETCGGRRLLMVDGMDTSRFDLNPVVTDTHSYGSIENIIGSGKLETEGRLILKITVTFARNTAKSEMAWELVKGGFLKAGSIGFDIQKAVEINKDESYKVDENLSIEGPITICEKWQLVEFSLVPLPADAGAVICQNCGGKIMKEKEMKKHLKESSVEETNETEEIEEIEEPEEVQKITATEKESEGSRKEEILDITPPGMEVLSSKCIAEGKTVEETRKIFLAELEKISTPAGGQEPEIKQNAFSNVSDDDFIQVFCR